MIENQIIIQEEEQELLDWSGPMEWEITENKDSKKVLQVRPLLETMKEEKDQLY